MSGALHTPGPWRASLGTLIRVFAAPGHVVICGVHKLGRQTGEYDRKAQAEVAANAHLIAACPDMLASLTTIKLGDDAAPLDVQRSLSVSAAILRRRGDTALAAEIEVIAAAQLRAADKARGGQAADADAIDNCTHCGCKPEDVALCCTTGAGRPGRPCDGEAP